MDKLICIVSHCPDPLINKRLDMLREKYDVCVLYIERGNSEFEKIDNVEYIKLNVNYINGKIYRRIFDLLKLKKTVNKILTEKNAKIIYAFRLDMLLLVAKSKFKNCKIIYEVADLHNAIINNSKNIIKVIIRKLLYFVEKNATKNIHILSITSEKYYDVYFSKFIPKDKVVYMPNIPNTEHFKEYKKKKDGEFTVGFIGFVRYKEQMKMLIEASKRTNVKVFFAGASDDDEIMEMSKEAPNVEYYGRYNYNEEIANLYSKCDCIYSVYDTSYNNVKYALPNKLYESIYCEIPILVSDDTYLGELVNKWNVGVTVNSHLVEDLIKKIELLRDNKEYYNQLVNGCVANKDNINMEIYNKKFIERLNV